MDFKFLETAQQGEPGLRAVEVGVTSRCNLRCDYCCAYDLEERRILSARECIEVLSGLPHLERVKLSGGEVLLRFEECREIVRWCSERGLFTQINTNATLLDPPRIAALAEAGLKVLHVSLNHTDRDSYARFYRVRPTFFDTIVGAIGDTVRDGRIEVVAETILFDETRLQLADVHHFAAGLGVRKHEIQMEIPSIHTGYSAGLSREVIARSIGDLLARRHPEVALYFSCLSVYFPPSDELWSLIARQPPTGVVATNCIEGRSQLHVHSNGDVLICELGCPEVIGNVFEGSLQAIFESRPEKLRAFLRRQEEHETFACYRPHDYPAERRSEAPLITNLVRRAPQR
jgi:MoaA/NifB/PqqE/SkfB family radical SAM enzyme